MTNRTPIFDEHVKRGGKMVEFAGWEMPVRYSGIIEEHKAVRQAAGLFDVSHMGEIWVRGAEAEKALNYLTSNNVAALSDGRAQYSAILNEKGGVVDDIIVYRFSPQIFLVCVNASNADKDFKWLKEHNPTSAIIENASSTFGQVAIQGPEAEAILNSLIPEANIFSLKPFSFVEWEINEAPTIIARTGYTGEDGFEIFMPASEASNVWIALLEEGAARGLIPCGLGARDSLRLEACLPLHGHELGPDISVLESNLEWIVKWNKGDFIGKEALEKEKARGVKRKLVAFELSEPGIAREQTVIFNQNREEIGVVTSGSKTPTLDKSVGMAFVDQRFSALDSEILLSVRDKLLKGKIIKKPMYKRSREA